MSFVIYLCSMVRTPLIFFLSFLFFALSPSLHAQIPLGSGGVSISLVPENPKPNQSVVVKTQSFSTNLDNATFKWSVNGKVVAEGVGMKHLEKKKKKSGSVTSIQVEINTQNLGVIRDSITFRPTEVTLIWESDGYIPPFYKGRSFYTLGGALKVVAIPEFFSSQGKRMNPKDLVYTWKKNGEVVASASGYGKDFFISDKTSYLREGNDISVEVSSPRENITGSASVIVEPQQLEILMYEKSPLYGILFNKTLPSSFSLTNEEITLYATPFFFSTQTQSLGELSFEWTMNNNPIRSAAGSNELTLRKETGQVGSSDIGITIQNPRKVLQGTNTKTRILFQ